MIGNFWINPFGGEQYPHYIDSFGHHRLNEWSPALVDGLRIDTVVSDKQPESSQTPRCNRQPQRCEAVVALAVRVDTRHSKKESSYPVMIELGCHMQYGVTVVLCHGIGTCLQCISTNTFSVESCSEV